MASAPQGQNPSFPQLPSTQSLCLLTVAIILALWLLSEPAPWHPPLSDSGYESEHWLNIRYEQTTVYEWYSLSYLSTEQGEIPQQESEESPGEVAWTAVWEVIWEVVKAIAEN